VTPSARLAAAIEVLDELAARRMPADEVLRQWGKAHRFAGSGDRRALAEIVYTTLRTRAGAAWRMGADDGRALVLGQLAERGETLEAVEALFTGLGHAPSPLSADERARIVAPPGERPDGVRAGVPEFIADLFKAQFGDAWLDEAQALVGQRAPLDLRVNRIRGAREQAISLLKVDGLEPEHTPFSALGLRLSLKSAPDIQATRAFKTGWVEVQDEASQIAAALAGANPGMTVVDYCAGGGGKTLALAAAMWRSRDGQVGRLVATDVNDRRLQAMAERLARNDVEVELRQLGADGEGMGDLAGLADLVFVDAPCSGSGTWRRHPEGAWRVTPESIARLATLQGQILSRAATLAKPGGRLAYATCSVFAAENDAVAQAFANAHPQFRPVAITTAAQTPDLTDGARLRLAELAGDGHTLQLTPRRSGTDGFFLALFERSA
jgi:16S rRNA (cytosine967-C5)-methyltransferase